MPVTSQLLARLGPDWQSAPGGGAFAVQGNLPPPLRPLPRPRHQCPTALEALAAQVPFDGPRADVVAIAPWEVPNWGAHLDHMGRCPPQDRRAWVADLISRQSHSGTVIVTVAATVSSAGRFDALRVGGAGATLTQWMDGTRRTFTASWCLGTEVTQHDVDCFGLAKAAEWTSRQFFDHRWPRPSHVYFLCGSLAALASATNPRGLANQRERLLFHSSLSALVSRHPTVRFTTVWSPADLTRPTDSTARFKALAACRVTPRASLNRVQSAAYCKAMARERAFSRWAAEWTLAARARPYPSFVHQHTVTEPPNGDNHPLWKEAVRTFTDPDTGKALPVYSRHTTTTALRLAVGHAFTSDYSRRFRPDIPEDQLACRCGWPSHSFHHLLYECPRGYPFRRQTNWDWHGRRWIDQPPEYFFHKGASTFLEYLQATRIGFKPPSDPSEPFDPGGPPFPHHAWEPPGFPFTPPL